MIINELRRLVQAALAAPDGLSAEWMDRLGQFQEAADASVVSELLDRLESAESDALEQARLNGMGASREAALMAKLEAAEKSAAESIAMYRKARDERDELRAKIEAIEQQEPVAFALYSGWARKAVYLSEIEACEQRDRRQLTADLGGSLEAYRVVPLYLAPGAQPAPSFADAYQGAMEEVAIWKMRALEAEDMNRKFIAEINGPAHMGEPAQPAQPAPIISEGWKPIPEKHQTFDLVDLRLADGSVLCGCVPQSDGDYWWEGPSGEVFIDPKYAPVTHWRLSAAPEAKP